ncbi:unnamed protein product [Spirodela intermedia]|uniref:Uncharacterized protein n=1 Tax=Spirodela intermedia TaxID=51605 RepID=A0A7I8IJ82_SPIIN|nr:unnamed protein product [Spirodela intermedia]CAA6657024.1 unnamed protein product [Spirodela intermedia]
MLHFNFSPTTWRQILDLILSYPVQNVHLRFVILCQIEHSQFVDLGQHSTLIIPLFSLASSIWHAYAVEVSPTKYQASATSLVATAWGIGLIIGPGIGGYLAQVPCGQVSNVFSKESIFGRFPYLLPCLCISLIAVGVLVACIWLPETLHTHKETREHISYDSLEVSEDGSSFKMKDEQREMKKYPSEENIFKNWPLMSSIAVYCIFSFHDMAYSEKYGGLSFSTKDVGQVLAVSGFSLLVFQLSLYSPLERLLGPVVSSQIAGVLAIPLLSSYPLFAMLSGMIINTGMILLQNNAVDQHQRGAANGIAMTLMSLFKAAAPAAGGALLSWAQKRQTASFLPGDQVVFFALNVVELLGILLTFRPFLTLRNKPPST